MKIGLYNLEPKIVNTAMMQVSQYHKQKGDEVKIYNAFEKFDKVYAFSIFDYTDKGYVKKEMICGGTGFDVLSKLPREIEACDYDWALHPKCEFSIVWFSRGCIRNCPFCIVRKKEGMIREVKPKNLNPNGKYIKIQDNNFFASHHWKRAIKQILKWRLPVEFNSGIDVRIVNVDQGRALERLKLQGQIHIAWDNPKDDLVDKIKELCGFVKPYKIMCYVLIGYWSSKEEDLWRVEELRKLGVDPFVMPYDKKNKYQRDFARWVNHKAIFKSVKWEAYRG